MTKSALQNADNSPETIDPPGRGSNRINIVELLNLRDVNGLTFTQIGKQLGFTKQACSQAYKIYTDQFPEYEKTKLYQDNKASYLTQAEFILLQDVLDPKTRAKASHNNRGYVWDKVFNNNRVEQGKSTAGGVTVSIEVAYQDATTAAKQLRLKHAGSGTTVDISSSEPDD